jgi:hypothetical protein
MSKSMKDSLAKQAKHQADTKDSGGSGAKAINITKEMAFKPQVGKNKVDIIPFKAGKNNPNTEPGEFAYVLDFWVHKGVGPNNDNILCPAKNFRKPCPICEEIERMRQDGSDPDSAKALQAKRRVAYNFVDVGNKSKQVKVFEASHFLFEKELLDESMSDGDMVDFFTLEDGKTVCFRANEKSFKTGKYFEYKSFSFEDRKEGYPESFVKKAVCLDELLNVLSYDQVSALFFGSGIQADDPDADEDDEDEDDEDEDELEPEPVKKSKPAAKADGDKDVCPHGHKFGEYDEHDECADCDLWKKCM